MKEILDELMAEWSGPEYDLLRRNCCSFAEALVVRLGVGPTPGWLHRLADVGAVLDDDRKAVVHGLHVAEDELARDLDAMLSALGVCGRSAVPRRDELEARGYSALSAALKERGLDSRGTTEELAERLHAALVSEPPAVLDAPSPPPPPPP